MNREQLIQCAVHFGGDWNKIAAAIRDDRRFLYASNPDPCLTILDQEYPAVLRQLRYPPWVLFYAGDLSLLKKPMITIVGSRQLSPYGQKNTIQCAQLLKDKFVLVSGLAKGADGLVHKTAMNGGHTIGVIGNGLGTIYPYENIMLYQKMKQNDLILSEYPHHIGVQKHHFPWRNRLLAALGESIIVTQAAVHSGTMLTVNEGISLGKDIWCIPYHTDEEAGQGCNKLISEGAGILYDLSILKDFKPLQEKY